MAPDDQRSQDLYETDFYLWTQAQAEALRAEGARPGAGGVDWRRIAEEIEDVGKSLLRECYSRTATIIEHLFKLAWTRRKAPRSGWRATIRAQRRDLILALTPSIRANVKRKLESLHALALQDAEAAFMDVEAGAARDVSLRWTLAQILGEADDPIG